MFDKRQEGEKKKKVEQYPLIPVFIAKRNAEIQQTCNAAWWRSWRRSEHGVQDRSRGGLEARTWYIFSRTVSSSPAVQQPESGFMVRKQAANGSR